MSERQVKKLTEVTGVEPTNQMLAQGWSLLETYKKRGSYGEEVHFILLWDCPHDPPGPPGTQMEHPGTPAMERYSPPPAPPRTTGPVPPQPNIPMRDKIDAHRAPAATPPERPIDPGGPETVGFDLPVIERPKAD